MTEATQSSETLPEELKTYFLVLLSEFDAPQVYVYTDIQQIANQIKEFRLRHKNYYAYVFEGEQWRITVGRENYLIAPDRSARIPLFDTTEEEISNSGFFEGLG